jgi:hypothetical protein
VLLFALVIAICSSIRYLAPSFDGAMNLLPAKNLAVFGKYYSFYNELPFPSSIQTRFTLQMPAALFIRLFGVNNSSLLLASALYTLAFSIVFVILAKALRLDPLDRRINYFAGPLLLILPFFLSVGLRGWGEVITYFFVFSSLLLWIQLIEGRATTIRHYFAFGMLIGLAIVTKTVAFITIPIFLGVLILSKLLLKLSLSKYSWSILGFFAVIGLYELFRFANLGPSSYTLLFWGQLLPIITRAGLMEGAAGAEPSHHDLAKPIQNLLTTSKTLGTSVWVVGLHFIIPSAALAYLRPKLKWPRSTTIILSFLSLLVFGYLFWWVVLAPTAKTSGGKIRMLLPAFMANALLISLLLQYAFTNFLKAVRLSKRMLLICIAPLATSLILGYANRGAWLEVIAPSEANPFPSGELIRTINNLPAHADIYGYGYRQSPQLALHAKKPFKNLLYVSLSELLEKEEQYFLTDLSPAYFRSVLEVVEYETVAWQEEVGWLYRITGARNRFDSPTASNLVNCLTGEEEIYRYKYKFGVSGESNWTTHRFAFLLASGTYRNLSLRYYFPPKGQFRIDPLIAKVSVNGKDLGSFSVKRELEEITFQLDSETTHFGENNQVVVSLNSGLMHERQLYGLIINKVCFSN